MRKRLMIMVFICFIIGGSIYLFWKETVKKDFHASKVAPSVEAQVQGNTEKEKEPSIDYASVAQKLDQYLQEKGFNGTVLVADKNHIVLNKGYGYADVQNKIENTPQTKYRTGSITKMTISTSILQLQEKGKLNIQDNVNKYIPSFPMEKNITLQQLLTHTSGLPSKGTGKVNAASRLDLVTWIGKQKVDFPPGTGWGYTDYNYMVLAYIVEKVSGQPIDKYIKEHIFVPAGMHETGMGNQVPGDVNFSKGYKQKEQKLVLAPKLAMNWLYGCGEMYTTATDMKKLDEAIMSGKLFSSQSLQQMITPPSGRNYGFGFYVNPDYYHNHGVVAGWNTFNNFNWDHQIFVILFSNVQDAINDDFNKEFRKMVSDLLEKRG
ncbi:serine hydrolase domain-containing protein [Bacillus sp. DX4.1]|uniref:serine hydrolase domain-containing protein n=1 Tax=Bacillus sp. DX4.1 TaxID=3055867 RepID=UPI0025A19EB3|nr:serine hydrolase domain-containing protein [Bacillus sp. DX4.1]MDM5189749.1 serine hydrolase domain-containing protein [Bacillus sp. DX4.1]